MCKAGHHPIGPDGRLRQKRAHQRLDPRHRRITLVAHPQPEIQRHLIIARPGRVQAACGRADDLFQPRLHIHVDVFQIDGKSELSCFNF